MSLSSSTGSTGSSEPTFKYVMSDFGCQPAEGFPIESDMLVQSGVMTFALVQEESTESFGNDIKFLELTVQELEEVLEKYKPSVEIAHVHTYLTQNDLSGCSTFTMAEPHDIDAESGNPCGETLMWETDKHTLWVLIRIWPSDNTRMWSKDIEMRNVRADQLSKVSTKFRTCAIKILNESILDVSTSSINWKLAFNDANIQDSVEAVMFQHDEGKWWTPIGENMPLLQELRAVTQEVARSGFSRPRLHFGIASTCTRRFVKTFGIISFTEVTPEHFRSSGIDFVRRCLHQGETVSSIRIFLTKKSRPDEDDPWLPALKNTESHLRKAKLWDKRIFTMWVLIPGTPPPPKKGKREEWYKIIYNEEEKKSG